MWYRWEDYHGNECGWEDETDEVTLNGELVGFAYTMLEAMEKVDEHHQSIANILMLLRV